MYKLNQQDYVLLNKAEELFPGRRITERFQKCAALPKKQRYDYVLSEMARLPRQGLIRIGMTIAQSLLSHTENMMSLASNDKERKMCQVHDMREVLTRDFCHVDVGTKARKRTKIALENLAAKIIFKDDMKAYRLWHEYEDRQSDTSEKIKDIDMLEWKIACDQYNEIFVYAPNIRENLEDFRAKATQTCIDRNIDESAYGKSDIKLDNYDHQGGDNFNATLPNHHDEQKQIGPQPQHP